MTKRLLGAIAGDIIGSPYERTGRTKLYNSVFLNRSDSEFTDDTVCTCAIAEALMNRHVNGTFSFADYLKIWYEEYPFDHYGNSFKSWCESDKDYINTSYGNGSAMRASAIGYYAKSIPECRILAQMSASNSHMHVEGIKGAQAIAEGVFLFKDYISNYNKYSNKTFKEDTINNLLELYYPEWKNLTLDEIRPDYTFKVSCQESVPVALICVKESNSYEDCIIKAISMGGDSDTLAAMAGSIAYPLYGCMSKELEDFVYSKLDERIIYFIDQFDKFITDGYNKC